MSYKLLNHNFSEKDLIDHLHIANIEYEIWSAEPDEPYDVHQHQYDKSLFALQGSMTFYVGEDEAVTLHNQDYLQLDKNTWHSAIAGDNGCIVLEIKQYIVL